MAVPGAAAASLHTPQKNRCPSHAPDSMTCSQGNCFWYLSRVPGYSARSAFVFLAAREATGTRMLIGVRLRGAQSRRPSCPPLDSRIPPYRALRQGQVWETALAVG